MPTSSTSRVITSWVTGAAPEWHAAIARLENERRDIEAVVFAPGADPVYGFSTRLGHLDHLPRQQADEYTTVENHQIGSPSPLDARIIDLVSMCKLEQLHWGGTGIHPATFARLLAASDDRHAAMRSGAWDTSYGSGDVIPAAWWVRYAIQADQRHELAAGDAIALLNGSFYSTARALATMLSAGDAVAELLAVAGRFIHIPEETVGSRGQRGANLRSAVRNLRPAPAQSNMRTQLPVSLRDGAPTIAAIASAFQGVQAAVESRLDHSSGNPLFTASVDSASISARSQSSFLDFTLTFALTSLIQSQHLALALGQRVVEHVAAALVTESPNHDSRFVQPPKAAQAIVERAALVAGTLPIRFSGADSQGVEDLRDLSLLTADTAASLVAPIRSMAALIASLSPTEVDHHEHHRDELVIELFAGIAEQGGRENLLRAVEIARECAASAH